MGFNQFKMGNVHFKKRTIQIKVGGSDVKTICFKTLILYFSQNLLYGVNTI